MHAPAFRPPEPSALARGALLMTGTGLLFTCLDTTAKHLGQTLPPMEVAWARYVAHTLLILIVARAWTRTEIFRPRSLRMQLLRGVFLLGSTAFNFAALRYLQLAQTAAISFAAPLLVTALAGPLLGEWAGPRRWAAVVVGFVGVLIVTRPGFGLQPAMLLSLCSMLSNTFYALLTRRMGGTETAESLLMWSGLVGAVALTPVVLPGFVAPSPAGWALFAMMGVFGLSGHTLLVLAYRAAPAPVIAPFGYTQMVWMIGSGLIVFGNVPDGFTLVGTAIIAASGLYILHRERVRKLAPLVAEPPAT